MICPEHDVLVDYVDAVLDAKTATVLERHLVACQCCRSKVAAERDLIERMRGVPANAPRGDSDFMAGLLSLGDLPTQPMPARRSSSKSPATIPCHAPAQYVSARKPIGIAALAVVGCISAAVVAIHAPVQSGTPARMPVMRSQPATGQAPMARVIGFEQNAPGSPRP